MKILFVGLDYYGYAAEICAAFRRLGHEIDFHPIEQGDLPSKVMKKAAASLYAGRRNRYHRSIAQASEGQAYDMVLFVQVHQVAPDTVRALRAMHPQARFVLYNWDSLSTHDYRPWLDLFDYAATFDQADARSLGIGYLPLFATPAYFDIDRDRPKDFDLYFVGTVVTAHRFDALQRLQQFCDDRNLTTHLHMYCSPVGRLRLWRQGRSMPQLTGASVGFGDIIDLIERSRGTFDFANHRQAGYTMRLIENMCAERKIVTDNRRILDEPFYREDRFHVIDGYDFSGIPEFLHTPITSSLDTRAFSIDQWALHLANGGPAGLDRAS